MSLRRRILLSPRSNGQDPSPPPSSQVSSHVIIAVATTAAASLFLALIYYAVLRHHRRRPLSHLTNASASSSSSDTFDHPIWQIKTVGLDDDAIASIGSYAHRSPAAGGDLTVDCSCSVCLGELLDGDTVRLLPKCGHVFHVQCIDTWLRCHISCPLCRAAVIDPCLTAPAPTAADDAADVEESSAESNPTQSDEGRGQEGEGESEARVRVSVEIPPESSGALRSISMDLEKDHEGLELEKGHSESGRSFLFSRLGRARSSSVLPL